jgi:hypothetical protein
VAVSKSLDSDVVIRLLREVGDAAAVFEGRWSLGALARVDAELAQLLADQIQDYHAARLTGTMTELKEEAAACKRGYLKCAAVMEKAGVEDDGYLIGVDTATGMRVAIGDRRASAGRVCELHGRNVVWLNPDEVARLWASIQGLRRIDAVKEQFPGAEVVDLRPHTRVWSHAGGEMPWPAPDEQHEEDEE